MFWWLFLLCPLAYLVGGLNNAKIITKIRHVDLSKVGSGNAGATNVGRAMGFWWFLLVTVLDLSKGALITLGGYLYCSLRTGVWVFTEAHYIVMLSMGLAGIIGAIFPVWYKFKGGKGIATWIGLGFFINPLEMLVDIILFVPLLLLTHIMSISTLLGVIVWAVGALIFQAPLTAPVITLYCCIVALLLFSHRQNIVRIFTGKEKKFTLHKKTEIK